MTENVEKTLIQENLAELRYESFRIMLTLTAVISWIWFSWSIWPIDGYTIFRSTTWMVSGLLVLVVLLCSVIMQRNFYAAVYVFIVGLIAAITGSILLLKTIDVSYLYLVPIIFASLLFSQFGLVTTAIFTGVATLTVRVLAPNLQTSDVFIPLTTITLTTIAIFISTNNIRTTLVWTINGYQEAHKNELIAREHKTRLELVLKQLDSTLFNLQRTNMMLNQARNQADEARRLKQQFAQTISHELRTPLNLIVGFTETMIKSPEYYGGPLVPAYLRDLSVVYRNACHLQDLVNDVLDLARLESAYLSLESEKLDFRVVIEDAISTARQLVEGQQLSLYTHLPDDLPPIWGDAVRLKQVMLNLLNNAARFTERGSITVTAQAHEDEIIVSVMDTGIGIPEEHITDIFESFRQLENPMQRRNEGAGLGLAISKQLINLHGGRIWANSEIGKGSTFFFSLPVSQVETLDAAASPETTPPHIKQEGQRVALLVTRSPSAAALLSRTLSGVRTLIVPDLAQAHQAARHIIPQAVIIDTATKNLTDEELDQFAQTLRLSRTAIIACPLPGEEPMRQRFAVDGYLIKPITYESLWDVLRQFDETFSKVLVVDRDKDFARLLGRMLSNPVRQYQVSYAHRGYEAFEMVRRTRPDILLLDLHLPDMDGPDLIQRIRRLPNLQDLVIVIITAYEDIDASKLLTGHVRITKPFGLSASEIMSWLGSVLTDPAGGKTALHDDFRPQPADRLAKLV